MTSTHPSPLSHKLARVAYAVAQVTLELGAATVGIVQPTLPSQPLQVEVTR